LIELVPKKDWVNRFRERTSFSQLAQHLLHLDMNSQSCAGTHVFQALVKIDSAVRHCSLLDTETRKQLDSYLATTLYQVVQRQQADGSNPGAGYIRLALVQDGETTAEALHRLVEILD